MREALTGSRDHDGAFRDTIAILRTVVLGLNAVDERLGVCAGRQYENVAAETAAHQTRAEYVWITVHDVDDLFDVVGADVVEIAQARVACVAKVADLTHCVV